MDDCWVIIIENAISSSGSIFKKCCLVNKFFYRVSTMLFPFAKRDLGNRLLNIHEEMKSCGCTYNHNLPIIRDSTIPYEIKLKTVGWMNMWNYGKLSMEDVKKYMNGNFHSSVSWRIPIPSDFNIGDTEFVLDNIDWWTDMSAFLLHKSVVSNTTLFERVKSLGLYTSGYYFTNPELLKKMSLRDIDKISGDGLWDGDGLVMFESRDIDECYEFVKCNYEKYKKYFFFTFFDQIDYHSQPHRNSEGDIHMVMVHKEFTFSYIWNTNYGGIPPVAMFELYPTSFTHWEIEKGVVFHKSKFSMNVLIDFYRRGCIDGCLLGDVMFRKNSSEYMPYYDKDFIGPPNSIELVHFGFVDDKFVWNCGMYSVLYKYYPISFTEAEIFASKEGSLCDYLFLSYVIHNKSVPMGVVLDFAKNIASKNTHSHERLLETYFG